MTKPCLLCTNECVNCAQAIVYKLKEKMGVNEYTLNYDQIVDFIGETAFRLLQTYGFVRYINTNKKGKQMYIVLEGGNKQ